MLVIQDSFFHYQLLEWVPLRCINQCDFQSGYVGGRWRDRTNLIAKDLYSNTLENRYCLKELPPKFYLEMDLARIHPNCITYEVFVPREVAESCWASIYRVVEELMVLNCGVREDSWESLGLQGDPTSPAYRRSVPGVHWKDWSWSWNSNTLATSYEELTHWKRPWCWEGLGAGGEGDNRGWDGWMASPTRWTWVWVNSRSWWWTGRPGMLWFMGLQSQTRLSDWTELNWEWKHSLHRAMRRNKWSNIKSLGVLYKQVHGPWCLVYIQQIFLPITSAERHGEVGAGGVSDQERDRPFHCSLLHQPEICLLQFPE